MVTLTFRIPEPGIVAKFGCGGFLITDQPLTLNEVEQLRALKLDLTQLDDGDEITIPSDG
jgi:hypothetical protein